MVQQHLGIWLVDRFRYLDELRAGWVYVNLAGGAAAPLFVTLAGVGVALGAARRPLDRFSVRRGVWLVGFGVALNLLVPSWFSWGSFYILHLLGVWLMLAPWVSRLSDKLVALSGACVLAGSVVGQILLETPIKLQNERMADLSLQGGVIRLALLEGQFPLLPWLAVACFGLVGGRMVSRGEFRRIFKWAGALSLVGVAARLPAVFDARAPHELPWRAVCRTSFFPMSVLYALLLSAVSLALLASFLWVWNRRGERYLRWLVPFGRTSLSLLVLHIVVFRQCTLDWGMRSTLSPGLASLLIVGFLTLWWLFCRLWAPSGYRFGLEWALRALSKGGSAG